MKTMTSKTSGAVLIGRGRGKARAHRSRLGELRGPRRRVREKLSPMARKLASLSTEQSIDAVRHWSASCATDSTLLGPVLTGMAARLAWSNTKGEWLLNPEGAAPLMKSLSKALAIAKGEIQKAQKNAPGDDAKRLSFLERSVTRTARLVKIALDGNRSHEDRRKSIEAIESVGLGA